MSQLIRRLCSDRSADSDSVWRRDYRPLDSIGLQRLAYNALYYTIAEQIVWRREYHR
jgi:hypothetical protein